MCRCKLGISIFRYVHFGQMPLPACLVKTFVLFAWCMRVYTSVSWCLWMGGEVQCAVGGPLCVCLQLCKCTGVCVCILV